MASAAADIDKYSRHCTVMLIRPRTCCLQLQPASISYRPSSISFISSLYLPIRIYNTSRSYEPKPKFPLQRTLPASVALNPPITTRPPPLSLPEKLPHLPKYKYYFRVGKAYAVFYKTGFKAIWTNYKLARALPDQIFSSGQAKLHQAVLDGLLSRADFQLIRRSRRDIKKVPLFALIWLICGEFTPLVVLFFTGAVPPTIWIPKQVQKAREEAEARRARIEDPRPVPFASPSWESDIESMPAEPQREVLKSWAQSLDLYPVWVRTIPMKYPPIHLKYCHKTFGSKMTSPTIGAELAAPLPISNETC